MTSKVKSRSITLAENWKKREIDRVLNIRNQMIDKKINESLIAAFLEDSYNEINLIYSNKIKKSLDKNNNSKKDLLNKKKKAIKFLLENKKFMENNGYDPEYIKEFVNKKYELINEHYKFEDKNEIDFID